MSTLSSPPTPHFLTATEAAQALGLSRFGVHRAVRSGKLQPVARLGAKRLLVFSVADIERAAQDKQRN